MAGRYFNLPLQNYLQFRLSIIRLSTQTPLQSLDVPHTTKQGRGFAADTTLLCGLAPKWLLSQHTASHNFFRISPPLRLLFPIPLWFVSFSRSQQFESSSWRVIKPPSSYSLYVLAVRGHIFYRCFRVLTLLQQMEAPPQQHYQINWSCHQAQ